MHKCVYAPISEMSQCSCPVRLESQVKQNDLSVPNLVKERRRRRKGIKTKPSLRTLICSVIHNFKIATGACIQSSQIVSRSMSPRRSAPQTLHRFRLSLEPKAIVRPRAGKSKLPRPFASDASPASVISAAAFNWACFSASSAASSASGESGMVSRLEILGLRDLSDVGVDGTEERAP